MERPARQQANWENRTLFHGDNLLFLRGMNSSSVDLIATDPPFNKGRDFHATPDSLAAGAKFQDRWSWNDDIHQDWVDQITDDHPTLMQAIECARHSHSDGMGAFVCFMAVRLLEMFRVLSPMGSLFLHCDPTASHYLKTVLDAIFGWNCFRNEIIWSYRSGGGSKKHFGRKHDILFWYSRSRSRFTFNTDSVRVPYSAAIAKKRQHLFNEKGKVVGDVWDISRPPNHSKEWVGYPTQKPIELYERIIRACSNKCDIVLDPFAGCATTLIAAERLERQWVGIDIWDSAHEVVLNRLEQEGLIESGRESVGLFQQDILLTSNPPVLTQSDVVEFTPVLPVPLRVDEPKGSRMSRNEMYEVLLSRQGLKCQGCDRTFDDPRYLELDHNTPRSDGGINHISNRILLCSPCNRAKSNQYTLSGLRRLNIRNGWMKR